MTRDVMNSYTDIRRITVEQLQSWLKERMPEEEHTSASNLAEHFYRRHSLSDLSSQSIDDRYGSLLCLWQFIQQRKPAEALVRAYNPEPEEHHWHSTHSVIEILADDMPFLVASVLMELDRQDLVVHELNHPTINIVRDSIGKLVALHKPDVETGTSEALIRIEIDRQPDEEALADVVKNIELVVGDVQRVVEDWPAMQQQMDKAVEECQRTDLPVEKEQVEEVEAFLEWLKQDNFLFIGHRFYDFDASDDCTRLVIRDNSGLGCFREEVRESPKIRILSDHEAERLMSPELLVITKSITRSTVQRPAHMDYVAIRQFDERGQVVGESRFYGLFTSKAYDTPQENIPLMREKVTSLLAHAREQEDSYRGKALRHIISHYPRDELLQASQKQLQQTILGILDCQQRKQLRVFLRPDSFGRFVTAMVYVPRDRFNTQLRITLQQILQEELKGHSVDFNVRLSDNPLTQVQFTIHCKDLHDQVLDAALLEARMTEVMLGWEDHLHQALIEQHGEAVGRQLYRRYVRAFPAGYREDVHPRQAATDIVRLEALTEEQPLNTSLYQPVNDFECLHFRVLGLGEPLALSRMMPILDQMQVQVQNARPYTIRRRGGIHAWGVDFSILLADGQTLDSEEVRQQFQEVFIRTWRGELENDGFNALAVNAGLRWREVNLLRALSKYLLQLQVPFSQAYMQQVLNDNPAITRNLVTLFETRFDPALEGDREAAIEGVSNTIEALLEKVENLDNDRILRHFLSVIQAMQRTNAYQQTAEGNAKSYMSFKLLPNMIPAAPLPRPEFEIFVYSPQVEGVHMRGGKVARGGLRWSDRREDFRTEILGLVKAQMVKNAVIVPHGAKGGFIPKQLPVRGSREEILAEGISSYKTFISGLLDITDNMKDGELLPPLNVIRHDGDDPYLVVAADKGTATFSDIANEISESYGFWLGDAFASGGSQGYDHKKMGITARGAWESVKRLFKETGLDTQNQSFTAIGVGDMAGDVFGNGMLLSGHIRLVAAFNHMHIFIDPTPNAASSYQERQRLFRMPRSSWDDYNRELISRGGGIFSRKSKSIRLSAEARKALNTDKVEFTPAELIQTILQAPVDLLWNGGIGTYVKAGSETHAEVGDRANDAVRIDATDLRVKVVGEGGNLGLTQKARVEFARHGGLINTDAVDNSGGVDSSDHEVNIKILLNQLVAAGDMTLKQRNVLLADMTDEVAALVLRHNFLQSQQLSLCVHQNSDVQNDYRHFIRSLEKSGRLNRELESLPEDRELKARLKVGEGLTRPEVSVLLSYAKLKLFDELVQEGVAQDEDLMEELLMYFPTPLRERFAAQIVEHPLKAEILATHLANIVGNRMGPTYLDQLKQETRCSSLDAVRAFFITCRVFGIPEMWRQFEAAGFDSDDGIQRFQQMRIQHHIEKTSTWLLRTHMGELNISALIERYRSGTALITEQLEDMLGEHEQAVMRDRRNGMEDAGLSSELATTCAGLRYTYHALDILQISERQQQDVIETARAYFSLEDRLSLPWLREEIRKLPAADRWQRKAQISLRDQLDRCLSENCARVLETEQDSDSELSQLDQWLAENESQMQRWQQTVDDIQVSEHCDLAMLSVAIQALSLMAA
ncbi:NAD-glutamate dehydrogenase [Endozoicomonadaceae bacterium StTr2]